MATHYPHVSVVVYSDDATSIVSTREYASRPLALRAIRRHRRAGRIAGIAGVRTDRDPPTCHH